MAVHTDIQDILLTMVFVLTLIKFNGFINIRFIYNNDATNLQEKILFGFRFQSPCCLATLWLDLLAYISAIYSFVLHINQYVSI